MVNTIMNSLPGVFLRRKLFQKLLANGIGAKVHWHDIEILNEENGRPVVLVKNFPYTIHVAITHSGDFVNTVVVIERLTIWERVSLKLFPKRGSFVMTNSNELLMNAAIVADSRLSSDTI